MSWRTAWDPNDEHERPSELEYKDDLTPEEKLRADIQAGVRPRCDGCGRFLSADSTYANRCSDCWSPEDDLTD